MRVKTGVKKDGAITAMHFQTVLDGGGYGSYGVASTYYTGALQTVTYQVPAYRFDGARVFTNKPPCGPKRGHGTPQPRFALEVAARQDRLRPRPRPGRDPPQRTCSRPNSLTANFLRVGSIGLGACIDKVVAASGWKKRRGKLPPGRGLGLACSSYLCGAGLPIYWNTMPQSGVQLKLDRGGGVTVFCGSTDIGQGSDSILASIVAEVLGIDPFDIRVVTGDTDLTPVDLGSYSSRVTLMTGNAAIQAAERAREMLVDGGGREARDSRRSASASPSGRVFDVENPETGMTFPEAVVAAESKFGTLGTVGSYSPPPSAGRYRGAGVGPVAGVLLLGRGRRGRGGSRDRHLHGAEDLDRARRRQVHQPGARDGPGRGLRLHGPRRGDDGRDGVPHRRQRQRRPQVPVAARVQEPDDEGDVARSTRSSSRTPTRTARSAPRKSGRARSCRSRRPSPTPSTTPSACASTRCPITPEKILEALKAKAQGKPARFGPERFPEVPYPAPIHVRTPAEGGDGKAVDAPVTAAGGVR